MSLASESSGNNPLTALQNRVAAWWTRQMEQRLIQSLSGVMASNVANNAGGMVNDVTPATAPTSGVLPQDSFNAGNVIETAATLGDRLNDMKAIAMHSHCYVQALVNGEIQFIQQSVGDPLKTHRGMVVVINDNSSFTSNGMTKYISVLFGERAVPFGMTAPRVGPGIEVYRLPRAGNDGGQETLHSRFNVALTPIGWSWSDDTGANALANPSPGLADLANGAHWSRVYPSRKSLPLAFLVTL
jgi:hypothetical protein